MIDISNERVTCKRTGRTGVTVGRGASLATWIVRWDDTGRCNVRRVRDLRRFRRADVCCEGVAVGADASEQSE